MNPGDDNRRGGGATRMNSQDRKFKTMLDGIEDVDVKSKNKIVTAFIEKRRRSRWPGLRRYDICSISICSMVICSSSICSIKSFALYVIYSIFNLLYD